MNMKPTLKKVVLAVSVAFGSLVNAQTETLLYNNQLEFTGLNDQTGYELKLRLPQGELKTLYINPAKNITFDANDFAISQFQDGFYKYELVPLQTSNKQFRSETSNLKSNSSQEFNVLSGTFTVLKGSTISDQDEQTRDQQILDDLIVDGSICAGMDCVNGESFGFDTIRLKENNLRIRFVDTSNSASFPTNDWELTANDSSNGGANKFSITDVDAGRAPFTVEAGARANALYVDNGGRVGVGTNSPVVEMHVTDGDSPTLRLEQNGTSGWTPQIWDVAGNETNFFVRDTTNGSSLPFRIRPGAPQNALYIDTDGDVGFGTASPTADFEVASSESFTFFRISASGASPNTSADITFTDGGADGSLRFNIDDGDGPEMTLDDEGDMVIAGTLTTATTTYPDYVFNEDYQLMPLKDVKSFIQENGHLPNVPSADEMIKKGINLTDMHVKLMEKVEELTLYTLAQESKLEAMSEQMAKQNELIKAFEKQLNNKQ